MYKNELLKKKKKSPIKLGGQQSLSHVVPSAKRTVEGKNAFSIGFIGSEEYPQAWMDECHVRVGDRTRKGVDMYDCKDN